MNEMKNKKFLEQVYNKIGALSEQSIKITDGSIEILDGDKVIFKIDSKGGIFYSAGKQFACCFPALMFFGSVRKIVAELLLK